MTNKKQELEAQLDHLRQRCAQHRNNLKTIAALLEKADSRRNSHPEQRKHWEGVIENLEFCLDQTKARLASCEASILRLERRLKTIQEESAFLSTSFSQDEGLFAESPELSTGPGDAFAVAKCILKMPSEEMGRLTLDAISDLQSRICAENTAAAAPDIDHVLDSALTQEPSETSPREQRKQVLLRGAIEKIQKNRIAALTEEEKRLLIASHDLLLRKCDDTLKGERLKRILGAAVNILVSGRHSPSRPPDSEKAL